MTTAGNIQRGTKPQQSMHEAFNLRGSHSKNNQVVIVSSPRSIQASTYSFNSNGVVAPLNTYLPAGQTPLDSHRSSLPAKQSYANEVSADLQTYTAQSSSINNNRAGVGQQNQADLQNQIKTGRVGIFGNYLASRISSIQQQKFLLQSNSGGPSGMNNGSQPPSNPLSSRKTTPRHSVGEAGAVFNSNIKTIDGSDGPRNATQRQYLNGGKTLQLARQTFGSANSNQRQQTNMQGPRINATISSKKPSVGSKDSATASPFAVAGRTKMLSDKGQGAPHKLSEGQHLRKQIRRDSNLSIPNERTAFSQQPQRLTQNQPHTDPESLATKHSDISSKHKRSTVKDHSSRQEAAHSATQQVQQSNMPTSDAQVLHQSYQGNFTKILKQAHINEQIDSTKAKKMSNNSQQQYISQHRTQDKIEHTSAHIANKGTSFFSFGTSTKTAHRSQFGTFDETKPERNSNQATANNSGLVQPAQSGKTGSSIYETSNTSKVNESYAVQTGNTSAANYEDNYYSVKVGGTKNGSGQSGRQAVNNSGRAQNLRSQSHTPVQERNFADRGGNISPIQVRKNPANNGPIGSSVSSVVHKSFEHIRSKNNTAKKKPLAHDTRNLGSISKGIGGKDSVGGDGAQTQVGEGYNLTQLDIGKGVVENLNQGSWIALTDANRHQIVNCQEDCSQNSANKRQGLRIAPTLPINSKLNAALRHNARPGLGPCLEERQSSLIDKIWGKFGSEVGLTNNKESNSKKQFQIASARATVDGVNKGVALVNVSNSKRLRNEPAQTQPEVYSVSLTEDTKRALFFNSQPGQTGDNPRQDQQVKTTNGGKSQNQADSNQPVWLPKKNLIARSSILETYDQQSGHRNYNINSAENQALAVQNAIDDNFDYKDFNFIVGKQKTSQHANNGHNYARSNSPLNFQLQQNARYDSSHANKPTPMISDNYHNVARQMYGKKRMSSEFYNKSQIPMTSSPEKQTNIKIQIEDSSHKRKAASDHFTNMPLRQSQSNLYQKDNAYTYLSLSQKKKNQSYWQMPDAARQNGSPNKEDAKQMYHVTIQIDPTDQMPAQQSPILAPNGNPASPYQFNNGSVNYNIVKAQAVQVKPHVIQGMPGNYQVNSSPFEANPHYYDGQINTGRNSSLNLQAMNAMVSTRGRDRKALVFSPEPRLIEIPIVQGQQQIPADQAMQSRLNTIPMMYPIIPKRQARVKGQSASGLSNFEDKVGLDQCIVQRSSRDGTLNKSTDQAQFQEAIDREKMSTEQQIQQTNQQKKKQPYLCPYASAKIAKMKEKANQPQKNTAAQKPTEGKNGGLDSATEESKTDLRTAEQKAEDLKMHQKELMRKFLSKFPPKKLPNLHAELEEERSRFLQARKDANRKYTEISANNNKPGRSAPLKFVVIEGNNSSVIRRVMQSRLFCNMPQVEPPSSPTNKNAASTSAETSDGMRDRSEAVSAYPLIPKIDPNLPQNFYSWQESNTPHLFNFKWKPFSNGINFERLGKFGYKQLVNHIEGHQALTTKDQLFLNMKTYCEKKNLDVYKIIPLTFAVDFQDKDFQRKFDQIAQVVSLFERHITMSPAELSAKLQSAQVAYDKVIRSPLTVGPSEHQGKNLWLLKPTGFNRGIGIHVFNSMDDLQNILWTHYRIETKIPTQFINEKPGGLELESEARQARDKEIQKLSNQIAQDELQADPDSNKPVPGVKEIKNSSFIVQKYIEAPLLFRRRKFDIRIWTLISHDAKFYQFKEAYVRTSSEEYDLSGEKLDQVYVHLTNNAVQKYSKNYGKFEEGNIVSVKRLCQELAQQEQFQSSQSAEEIEASLYKQMREQILHSYEAVRNKLRFSKHSFELVGYDFMVVPVPQDEATNSDCLFETKLIEANTNPCLEESNQLLRELIPRMLDDLLKIVLDPLFGTTLAPQEVPASQTETGLPVVLNYPIEGYRNDENMFELIQSPPMPSNV